jgi:hypothetical protein
MTNHRRRATTVGIAVLLLISTCIMAQDKKAIEHQYKNKFVVVLKEGLEVGLCAQPQANSKDCPLLVTVANGNLSYKAEPGFESTNVMPEPIHKGEVLQVKWINVLKVLFQGQQCQLGLKNVSPHAVERGVGAFAHQSNERGDAVMIFSLDSAYATAQASALLNDWFKVFDTADEAATFGNTASGVFVKEIKAGMTIPQVESVLGTPETRIDLTDKTLYKYKSMTIEFHDGKVTDVR